MAKPIKVEIIGNAQKFNAAMASAGGSVGKFAGIAAGVGVAAVAGLGVAALKVGDDFDKAYDTIRVGTGATGDQLTALQDNFKSVVSNVPASFEDAGLAVADLNTKLGLTGSDLESMAESQLELARLTGGDLAAQIDSTARLMGDWGVATQDQVGTMDDLYQVSQTTGIGIDQLSTVATNFGAPMRALGFGFEDATMLLGKFQKEGVNTEAIMAGMKAGLGKMAKAGEDPIDTFTRLTDEMANAATDGDAMAIAVEAFGQRAGPDMAMAVREGRFELDELRASMSTDTISEAAKDTESFGEKWTKLKNGVLVKLEPLIMKLFDGLGRAMDAAMPYVDSFIVGAEELGASLQEWWEEVGPGVMEFIGSVVAAVRDNWPVIQATITNVMTVIQEVISGVLQAVQAFWSEHGEAIMGTIQSFVDFMVELVDYIMNLWEDHGEEITAAIQAVWEGISSVIGGALEAVQGIWETFAGLFSGDWGRMWDGIKAIFSGIWNALGGIVRAAFEVVKSVLRVAIQKVTDILLGLGTALGNTARDVWNKAWDIGKSIINGIKDGVTGAVGFAADIGKSVGNAIVGFINRNVIDKFNRGLEFRIEVFGRGVDINPPDVPHLPRFATGGFSSGGLAIVGERGPELVNLPRGSRVTPNHGMTPAAQAGVTVNVQSTADPAEIGRELLWTLKTSGR